MRHRSGGLSLAQRAVAGTKLVSSTGRLCRCASSERSGGDSAGRSVVQLSHALSGSQVIQSPRPQRDRRLDLKSLVTALPLARLGGALQVRRSWILYMVDDHLVVLVVDAGIVATSTSGKTPREPRSLPAPSSIGVELWISPARWPRRGDGRSGNNREDGKLTEA